MSPRTCLSEMRGVVDYYADLSECDDIVVVTPHTWSEPDNAVG